MLPDGTALRKQSFKGRLTERERGRPQRVGLTTTDDGVAHSNHTSIYFCHVTLERVVNYAGCSCKSGSFQGGTKFRTYQEIPTKSQNLAGLTPLLK